MTNRSCTLHINIQFFPVLIPELSSEAVYISQYSYLILTTVTVLFVHGYFVINIYEFRDYPNLLVVHIKYK